MPVPSNVPFFSAITGRLANKFPNSGTLVYRLLSFWKPNRREMALILLNDIHLVHNWPQAMELHRSLVGFVESDIPRASMGIMFRLRRPPVSAN
jgi:hypothetical protein